MNEKKLFIATSSFAKDYPKLLSDLKKNKVNFQLNPLGKKLKKSEILKYAINSTHLIAGTEKYDLEILNKLKHLRLIFRLGSGTENIDLDFALKKNIKILKPKITLEKAVGELTIGLILNLLRKINTHDKNLKLKIWKKEMGNLLYKKNVGIIGYGKIGRYVGKLVKAFGAKILINDVKNFKNKTNLKNIFRNSDIVTIHSNFIKKDFKLINKNYLKLLKKNAIIINTSRSEILDYEYLYYLLKHNKIRGAALDVFDIEPYYGKLIKLQNTILTPHIGSYASEIRNQMEKEAVKSIIKHR